MGTGSFLGVKSGRGVTLTPQSLPVMWSWKRRAIPLLPLWAVRPVQSLSACSRALFTFTLPSHTYSSTPILIFPFRLGLGLLTGLFLPCFPTKNLHAFYTPPIYLIHIALHHKISWGFVSISCPTTQNAIVDMYHKSQYRLFICNINLLLAVDTSLAKKCYIKILSWLMMIQLSMALFNFQ